MSDDLARGRSQLIRHISVGVTLLLLIGIYDTWRTGHIAPLTLLGRPIVFAALGAFGFQGRSWGPRVAGIWIALLALVLGGNSLPFLRQDPIDEVPLLAFAVAYLVSAVRLITSPQIKLFVAARRTERALRAAA